MKYIVIKSEHDCEFPLLFSENMAHSDAARGREVFSAGFCNVNLDDATHMYRVTVYGESISLKKKPRPCDEAMIARMFNPLY